MRLTTSPRLSRDVRGSSRISRPIAVLGVAVGLAATYLLDRGTGSAPVQHLYYLPIILAAFTLRLPGGVAASLIAIILYHLANPSLLALEYREPDLVQMALFIAVGLVTARLTANARRLHTMAMTDDLTGLHNLRSFEAELSRLIHGMRASGGAISLMVLDLDRLKSLNDTHGHLTGAEAVRSVGHILATHLPPSAVACRYGGDEFVVALPHASDVETVAIAERLCHAVNDSEPTLAGRYFSAGTLSISVGVAHRTFSPHSAGTRPRVHDQLERRSDDRAGEALFRAADAALYAAKSRGRNQVFLALSPASHAVATGDLRA